jgi:hypothetical protein
MIITKIANFRGSSNEDSAQVSEKKIEVYRRPKESSHGPSD